MGSALQRLIGAAFGPDEVAPAVPSARSRRRKKLWELPTRWHCPLIGTCLPVAEMRKLAARAGFDERAMGDYTLHATVVGACGTRSEIAELVQRHLEKRHAAAVLRFGKVRGEAAVVDLWHKALLSGHEVAGALWAAWSHADMGDEGGGTLYGDIHMLSHQVGAAARADLHQLEQLKLENARLRDETQALRIGLSTAQRAKEEAVADLRRRLTDAEQHAALLGRRELELAAARKAARDHAAVLDRATALAGRVERIEERNAANARRAEMLAAELNETQDSLAAAEAALELALGVCNGNPGADGCGHTCPAEARLAGRCVLCIGGRTGLVEGYRRLVETQGGHFLHHDGGQEESLHRINAAISGADAVVCQSGCISHAAYWRLKEACKKLGKPCVFLKSPGVGSFARGLAALGGAASSARMIRLDRTTEP